MHNTNIKRNEIYYADLSPTEGAEQGGVRPVLVIQNDMGNKYSPTVIICPITGANRTTVLPTHVRLGCNFGLYKNSTLFCEQIRAIDKKRLKNRIGIIDDKKTIEKIDKALHISLALTLNKVQRVPLSLISSSD